MSLRLGDIPPDGNSHRTDATGLVTTPGQRVDDEPIRYVMSIDVEDWFQVENLRPAVDRERWDEYPRRVVGNTERVLDIFARTGTTATFFVLGWVAERHPELVRRINDAGHEVAGHGYAHRLIYEQSIDEFRADVVRAKEVLEEITGRPVYGYRAPSFSITAEALCVLAETGHTYDSSYFPALAHDRYSRIDLTSLARPDALATSPSGTGLTDAPGSPGAPSATPSWRVPLASGMTEYPITTLRVAGTAFPWGGGGYFRLYPPALFRTGFRVAASQNRGAVFYLHPWEVDPDQPRVAGLRRSHAFRHYVNLAACASRLERLCSEFPFQSFSST